MFAKMSLAILTLLFTYALIGGTVFDLSHAETINYTYDSIGQLTKAAYGNGTTVEYVYDMRGNRLLKTVALAGSPANTVPKIPSAPKPANGATGIVMSSPAVSWTGGDPDAGDVVSYDIYFGTTNTPPLVASGIQTSYSPGQLKAATKYYWKVVAEDGHHASTSGPLWSFTTKNNAIPVVSTFAPALITSVPSNIQMFSSVFSDADGSADLKTVDLLVSPGATRSTVQGIWASYNRSENRIYLYNDFGSSTAGYCVPGISGSIQNTQGKIDCGLTTIATSGNTLSVNWAVMPLSGYDSVTPRTIWLMVKDNANAASAWVKKGTWKMVPSNSAPVLGTLTPNNLSLKAGTAQQFVAVYTDAEGFANLKTVDFQVSPTSGRNDSNAIWATYNRNENRIYLAGDHYYDSSGSCNPGSAVTLQNTQGRLNCAQTLITTSGKNLTVKWNITPKAAFVSTTPKSLWMTAKDNSNAIAPWTNKGQWTVKSSTGSPQADEATPIAEFIGGNYTGFLYSLAGMTGSATEMSFDGKGQLNIHSPAVPEQSILVPYALGENGKLTLGNGVRWRLSEDSQVLVLADTIGANLTLDIGLGMAIKKAEGMTAASLNGRYTALQYEIGNGAEPVLHQFTFDGNGSVTITASDMTGVSTAFYSVSSDGRLTMAGFTGQVKPDAQILALINDSRPPGSLLIGVKQSSGMPGGPAGEFDSFGIKQKISGRWSTTTGTATFNEDGTCTSMEHDDEDALLETTSGLCFVNGAGGINAFEMNGIVSTDGSFITLTSGDDSGIRLLLKKK